MKRNVLFLGVAILVLVAIGANGSLRASSADAHSGAEQLGIQTVCATSLGPFIAAKVTGPNQYGRTATWTYSGRAICSVVTTGWWWQTWNGVKVELTHQDGRVSCKRWYVDDYWWQWWNTTVWVTQKYDDRC